MLPVLFLGVLFYWPLLNILSRGFTGDWTSHLIGARDLQITWFTIWQALVSMLVTVGLAIPSAYVMYRKSFPGQRFFRSLITIPFMLRGTKRWKRNKNERPQPAGTIKSGSLFNT